MNKKIAAVLCGAFLATGFTASSFAACNNMGCQTKSVNMVSCDQTSQYCGYQVGVVPAGKCDVIKTPCESTFCGYLVGTYPAGKCVNLYVK